MYDISQLNDLLVPELQDIAMQQNITNAKKLDKQELIDKILLKQNMNTEKPVDGEKPKRKRILKPIEVVTPIHEAPEVTAEKNKPELRPRKSEVPVIQEKVAHEKVIHEKKKYIKKPHQEEVSNDDNSGNDQDAEDDQNAN